MVKRTRFIGLLVVLVCGMLAACVPSNSLTEETPVFPPQVSLTGQAPPTPTKTPTVTPTPPWQVTLETLNNIHLTFYYPWVGGAAQFVEKQIDTFNQTNEWGIFVEGEAPGGSYMLFSQVSTVLSTGGTGGIVAAPIEQLAYWNAENEGVVDLSQYLDDPVFGFSEDNRQDFMTVYWQQAFNGKQLLGIPVEGNAEVLIYNQSWAKELGFNQPPATPQEFQAQACAARDALLHDQDYQNDGTGGWIINPNPLVTLSWMNSFDYAGFAPEHLGDIRFNTPETIAAMTFLRGLADETCAWNSREPAPYSYFSQRNALFYSANVAELFTQDRFQKMAASEDNWTVIPFPNLSGAPQMMVDGSALGVLNADNASELAGWLFVRWFSTPEIQAGLVKETGTLPVLSRSTDLLADQKNKIPPWGAAVNMLETAYPAPNSASWHLAQTVLEDAAWQVFQPNQTIDNIPEILTLLDETIPTLK
ncbi:MAG: extracellular solute-binding protein [Anaerolineaceae bacterium]